MSPARARSPATAVSMSLVFWALPPGVLGFAWVMNSKMEFPQNPFWDYAIEVYRRDGVGQACLDLQGRHGVDVNVLLFCCWLGASGRGALDGGRMARLVKTVEPWHDGVVRGLRAVRTALKGGLDTAPRDLSDALRARIAATEIDSEHVEHFMMVADTADLTVSEAIAMEQGLSDAVANVGSYFACRGIKATAADMAPLATVFAAAFPELGREVVAEVTEKLGSVSPQG